MQGPSQFLFVRHGQTDWNLERRVQGRTDTPLNATGVQQAQAAAELLRGAGATMVISSPLLRAHRTAEIIAETLKLPLIADEALMERGFGRLEGLLASELPPPADPAVPLIIADYPDPSAEPMRDVLARVTDMLARHVGQGRETLPLFVSHGGIFRALTLALTGTASFAHNAQPYLFTTRAESWQVEELTGLKTTAEVRADEQ